jgi:serine-type D-Ala-D-Ala carboxypeptidase/endopeptidase
MVEDAMRAADASLRRLVERGAVVGMVVALLRGDERRVRSYGTVAAGRPAPPGPDTVFEIGSVTKTFTALLLHEMAGRGEVALDDPIGRHLPPEVPTPTLGSRSITLLDLVTHTARLPNNGRTLIRQALRDQKHPFARYSVEDLHGDVARARIRRRIGERVRYSNLGFGLLGHLLARAAGSSYDTLVTERITGPLGLADTAVHPSDRTRYARGHMNRRTPAPDCEIPTLGGAGALRSTARDMVAPLRAHIDPSTTPLEGPLEDVQRLRVEVARGRHGIASAWLLRRGERGTVAWHNGGTPGFGSFVGFDRRAGAGIVVLTNTRHRMRVDHAAFRVLEALAR